MLPVLFYMQNCRISKCFLHFPPQLTSELSILVISSNLLLRFRIWFSYPLQKKQTPDLLSQISLSASNPSAFRKMGVPLCFRVAIADPSTSSESQGGPHLTEWAGSHSRWRILWSSLLRNLDMSISLNIEIWHSNLSWWSLFQKPFPVWWGAYVSSFSGRVIVQPFF